MDTIRNRPSHVHLLVTGRDAQPEIKEIADLVSVIEAEKHYYEDGVEAVKGSEFRSYRVLMSLCYFKYKGHENRFINNTIKYDKSNVA